MTKAIFALRCEDFGHRQTQLFSFPQIDIFKATTFAARSSNNADRICFPEIGGTKKPGRAPNGMCGWRMASSFVHMNLTEPGRWMGFMTEIERNSRFVKRESVSRCNDSTI